MNKLISAIIITAALFGSSYAATEDTSIIDELNNTDKEQLQFTMKTFDSCNNFEDVM